MIEVHCDHRALLDEGAQHGQNLGPGVQEILAVVVGLFEFYTLDESDQPGLPFEDMI